MSLKNTLKLKEVAVSSIATAEDTNDTIHVFVEYRGGICPFNVNKCNVADTLLPYGAAGKFSIGERHWMIALLNKM